jgi:transcriptional regulator with XRE-family HTH domain
MRYRWLRARLNRAMGRMTIAELSRRSGISRSVISRVCNAREQYIEVQRAHVDAFARVLGVTYDYLAYGTGHDHPVRGRSQVELILENSRLLAILGRRERRSEIRPTNTQREGLLLLAWADRQKLEVKWTTEGKCQILHDHEYVLSEHDTLVGALELAHQEGT